MDLAKLHLHWRAGKRNGKEYRSYSLARSYREDGKNRKQIIYKLGKLSEKEVEQWRSVLATFKNPASTKTQLSDVTVQSSHAYLNVAVALEAWNSWGLNTVFDSVDKRKERDIPLSSIASLLTINRCIDPASKSRVPSWTKKTTLPFLLDIPKSEINPSRIFRELSHIESCKEQLSKHLCQKMLQDSPESMKSLFYDLSSTTFTGSRCVLVNWGHCKEGYENHVVLALIVNTKGLPIYWEVLEGGTADAKTISWLLNRLKQKLSISTPIPTMVFDRGMVSDENLKLLEDSKVKYITAMDKNQIEGITEMDFSDFKKMTVSNVKQEIEKNPGFSKLDKTAYCKEIKVIDNRRYILCFNPQLFLDQREARENQIANFNSFTEELNQELLQAKKNRNKKITREKFEARLRKAKLQNFINIELEEKNIPKQTKKTLGSIRSYQGTFTVNLDQKLKAGKLDGFWLLVTNHSDVKNGNFIQDTRAVVQPYRDKVLIESSFRDIKSFIEISPVHVWRKEHVEAHYTICVLAYLLDRTLTLSLHENKGGVSKDIVAHERLYEELAECRLHHLKVAGANQGIHSLTEQTDKQKDLLDRLQMTHLVSEATVKDLNTKATGS